MDRHPRADHVPRPAGRDPGPDQPARAPALGPPRGRDVCLPARHRWRPAGAPRPGPDRRHRRSGVVAAGRAPRRRRARRGRTHHQRTDSKCRRGGVRGGHGRRGLLALSLDRPVRHERERRRRPRVGRRRGGPDGLAGSCRGLRGGARPEPHLPARRAALHALRGRREPAGGCRRGRQHPGRLPLRGRWRAPRQSGVGSGSPRGWHGGDADGQHGPRLGAGLRAGAPHREAAGSRIGGARLRHMGPPGGLRKDPPASPIRPGGPRVR